MSSQRYTDYYLVNDEEEDMASNDESVIFRPAKKYSLKKVFCILSIILIALAVIAFILIFVGFPFIFKDSLSLQQALVFTRWNLPSNKTYYDKYRFPEFKNHYVTVKDFDSNTSLRLGLWHMLPLELAEKAIDEKFYDFDAALRNSNYSVLLYFHSTGEDRSQSSRKYQLLRYFFHVIAFDYRGYGDSDKGDMFEKNVVSDCVQVYKWLQNRTDAQIYVWGHSLGTALATSTMAHLGEDANVTGLVLESAFTTFEEELYHHPYVKYFKWLPWYNYTVVSPLKKNGFIFDTSHNILNVTSPILFLHAKDDETIPYFMSKKLYSISENRNVDQTVKNDTMLVLFDERLGLNHNFIYQDSYVIFYIYEFLKRCSKDSEIFLKAHIKVNMWL